MKFQFRYYFTESRIDTDDMRKDKFERFTYLQHNGEKSSHIDKTLIHKCSMDY